MHPNRVVAVAAAVLSLALAVLPVVGNLDWTSTAGVLAGVVAVLTVASKWLTGWQAHEARQTVVKPSVYTADAAAATIRAAALAHQADVDLSDPELDDPNYTDAPAIPTLEQHSNLGAPE